MAQWPLVVMMDTKENIKWGEKLLADLLRAEQQNTGNEPSISCFHRAFDELKSYLLRIEQDLFVEKGLFSEWEPIESAPRDGSEIIVFGGKYGCEFSPSEFHNGKIEDPVAAYFDKDMSQWTMSIDSFSDSPCYLLPEIWMQLPRPPKNG